MKYGCVGRGMMKKKDKTDKKDKKQKKEMARA